MSILIDSANWVRVLNSYTDCIIVCRQGKYHVRRYERNVRNGMPQYRADWECHYKNY